MGSLLFKTSMSGGWGNLQVSFDNVPDVLQFDQTTLNPLPVILPAGVNNYTLSGTAAPGATGNINLVITGDVVPLLPQNFGPDEIPVQSFPCIVT